MERLYELRSPRRIPWYVHRLALTFFDRPRLIPNINFIKIRTHPVTALKILNYNPTFVDRILELNGQESAHILAFLREHLLQADDLTVRWKWTPGAVAFWDNRNVVHKALPGGYNVTLREGKRTAVHGERPFFDPERSESLTQKMEREERARGAKREKKHMKSEPELNN